MSTGGWGDDGENYQEIERWKKTTISLSVFLALGVCMMDERVF